MILLVQIFINVGMLLSYVSNYAFAGLPVHLGWRVMFAMGVVPPVFIAAGVFFMPESPRWLAMRGRHSDARAVLAHLGHPGRGGPPARRDQASRR